MIWDIMVLKENPSIFSEDLLQEITTYSALSSVYADLVFTYGLHFRHLRKKKF